MTQPDVAAHYNERAFDFELVRLSEESPVEYAITLRILARHVAADSTVADIGVGVGHYAEALAERRCNLHLVDVARRLLEAAQDRLSQAGKAHRVVGVYEASATSLPLPDASVDACLLLGPLYHLTDPTERRLAVAEAARVLRPQGVVLAAAINRLAYFRDLFKDRPGGEEGRRHQHAQFLRDGLLNPDTAPPIGHAHLTTVAEFRALMEPHFEEMDLIGTESFTITMQSEFRGIGAEDQEAWLDLVEQTGRTPEGLGVSDHWLYVGRRR